MLERENTEQKQTADAKQTELKQALDKSEKRALALERENTEQKQTADARQTELKQALDKS
jgi:exonuclease VII large subunit